MKTTMKTRGAVIAMFLAIVMSAGYSTAAQVENLLQNPSFELDEAILDDPAWEGWVTWNPAEGAGSNATVVDTESADGARSLRIDPIGTANWHFIVLYAPIAMEAGNEYTASFWAKAQEPRPLRAQMKALDNSVQWGATDFELTTEWAEYAFTSEAGNAEVKFEVFCAGSEIPLWLDFVQVYEGAYVGGLEPLPAVTIPVDPNGDIAAANAMAKAGDTIEIAEGTYYVASQIEIKEAVTYRGAGPGLTIIDGNDATRAFVAWGDRTVNEGNENPNDSGPKGWVLEGMTIQNCVADIHDRFSYQAAAFTLKADFATLDADVSGGLSLVEADDGYGQIQLAGPDGSDDTEDDYIVDFQYLDKDGSGEISEAELDAQLALGVDQKYPTESGDGGAMTIDNGAVGTIQNCEFLNNHTPIQESGDDGGAINITGLSVVTINDCWFEGNYACSADSVAEDENDTFDNADGDGGHIKVQGNSASAITPGTTLIANRCYFLNGNAEDDGGAIQSSGTGGVIHLDSCWFEGNTSWDNGNVCQFSGNLQHEVVVTNCIFTGNITKADNSPDRMIETKRNSKFINCTFVGNIQEDQDLIYNTANTRDTDGDGVDDETADVTQVVNCLFVDNVVGNGDDVLGSRNDDFTIAATNCLFFGNTLQNGNPADNTQRPDDETGSITDDPLLDASYVPMAGSPAIDGGVDPSIVGVTLLTDYSGNPRPQGAAYDIGADEFVPEAPAN